MNTTIVHHRNSLLKAGYRFVAKPLFFKFDPEQVHDLMVRTGVYLGKFAPTRAFTAGLFNYQHPALQQTIQGIVFQNPVGLSAGFDKNAELTDILPTVGFGFAEVGSITGEPCAGNPKPRLWRLPQSQSLLVWYGLKNDGAEAIAKRLATKTQTMPLGVSVAMTNCAANNDTAHAIADFAKAFRLMEPHGAYVTVNISCPNTSGGQPFVDPEKLHALFLVLDAIPTQKPVFIKLSPDLTVTQIDAILVVIAQHRVDGIICTNLTKKRDNPFLRDTVTQHVGGMSGKVVDHLSDAMIAYLYKKVGSKYVIIASGGIFSAEDAYRKIRLGASLVQLITGMIYQGPQLISDINKGLVALLARDGYQTITEAVGVDASSAILLS